MYFKLVDIIAISGAIQGVFLLVFLKKKRANSYLFSLVVMVTIILIGRGIFFHYPRHWPYQLVFIPDIIVYLFGPYLYFYFKSIVRSPVEHKLWHMIPAILFIIEILYLSQYSNSELKEMGYNGALNSWYTINELTGVLSGLTYLTLSMLALRKREELSIKKRNAQFSYIFIYVLYFSECIWLVCFLQNYFGYEIWYLNYNTVWLFLPLVVYFLAFYSMIGSKKLEPAIKNEAEVKLPFQQELKSIQKKLELLIVEEQIHNDCNFTLKVLAERLNLTSNKTSWFLNQVYHESFNDFTNRLRLESFLKMVDEGHHEKLTILGLANECGFNSKSTFNKVFKDKMNTTPSAYIKSKKA